MDRRRDGMDAVLGLAGICETSLTSTAIRYAEVGAARTAIVVSSGSTIDYCFLSKSLRDLKGLRWPKKGKALPKNSATVALRKRTGAVDNREQESDEGDTMIWFDTDKEIALTEEVIGLGEYGRTLTVLTVADEDEDEEEEPRNYRR